MSGTRAFKSKERRKKTFSYTVQLPKSSSDSYLSRGLEIMPLKDEPEDDEDITGSDGGSNMKESAEPHKLKRSGRTAKKDYTDGALYAEVDAAIKSYSDRFPEFMGNIGSAADRPPPARNGGPWPWSDNDNVSQLFKDKFPHMGSVLASGADAATPSDMFWENWVPVTHYRKKCSAQSHKACALLDEYYGSLEYAWVAGWRWIVFPHDHHWYVPANVIDYVTHIVKQEGHVTSGQVLAVLEALLQLPDGV